MSIASLCFLFFMAGSVLTYAERFPYALIDEAYVSAVALLKRFEIMEAKDSGFVQRVQRPAVTVKESGAYRGYTVYSMFDTSLAVMVDMDGNEVHRWELKDDATVSPNQINWFDVHAFANGDLIVVEEYEGGFPYGYGVRKLDKHSNTLWHSPIGAHHAAHIAEDGRIAVLWHRVADSTAVLGVSYTVPAILEEMLGIMSAEGKLETSLSLTRLFVEEGYRDMLLQLPKSHDWDMIHSNSVMLLDGSMASHFPMYKPGNMLVSMRNGGLIAVIDTEDQRFSLLKSSVWKAQHDARFMPDGTIMLFDNNGVHVAARLRNDQDAQELPKRSRILSFDPARDRTKVLYGDRENEFFFSSQRGRVERLPNGNLHITESTNGRIFEVDVSRRMVWEYVNPYDDEKGQRARIQTAKRYPESHATFLMENGADGSSPPR